MTELLHIPFRDSEVLAVEIDGRPHVVLRPAIEALGLDADAQLRKLKSKSWACTVVTTVQMPGDDQQREVVAVDVRTFLMLLATIPEQRVSGAARPLLVAYQSEVADVIEAYFTQGGAINPRASETQLTDLASAALGQAQVLAALRGVVADSWLEAKGRLVAARALGEEPELDPATLPVDVTSYLRERGVKKAPLVKWAGTFGKRLKALYMAERGSEPPQVPREINGTFQRVAGYTQADLPLFDRVFQIMAAALTEPA